MREDIEKHRGWKKGKTLSPRRKENKHRKKKRKENENENVEALPEREFHRQLSGRAARQRRKTFYDGEKDEYVI
ncbi:hypothetical protein CEXT_592291 [Caerostris extrusa]|uniref:Uncharacterized protein n=1 Tax=Caerostris extrusa TaxID=172846 RepID=A0AAV4VSS7_CAEEX|nr:hypothetical protein CEXT_592291 [Caerostris extrusa]